MDQQRNPSVPHQSQEKLDLPNRPKPAKAVLGQSPNVMPAERLALASVRKEECSRWKGQEELDQMTEIEEVILVTHTSELHVLETKY
jgi:hypothetical protein